MDTQMKIRTEGLKDCFRESLVIVSARFNLACFLDTSRRIC